MNSLIAKDKKNYRIAIVFLSVILFLATLFSASAFYFKSNKVSADTNGTLNILTVTPGAKAENGELSFHFWINKRALSEYAELVPLTHTYLNVLFNGELQPNLAYCVEGFSYVNWEYNLSDEDNVGYGQFVVTVDVSEHLTDKVQVVFGFTDTNESHIDLFSDSVSYTDVYYSPYRLEELELQIKFLETELARVGAESAVNYQNYESVKNKLHNLLLEYDALKNADEVSEKSSFWEVLKSHKISLSIILVLVLLILIPCIVYLCKTGKKSGVNKKKKTFN